MLENLTKENYVVSPQENGLIHAIMEKVDYDRSTGQKLSKPQLHKINLKQWDKSLSFFQRMGYTITILHDPRQPKQSQNVTFAKGEDVAEVAPKRQRRNK